MLLLLLGLMTTATLSSAATVPIPAHPFEEYPSALRLPAQPPNPKPALFPWLTWLRDSTIGFAFGHKKMPDQPYRYTLPVDSYHAQLMVVRFNITSQEEEEALAETADRLQLDIWATGEDWVDVSFAKYRMKTVLSLLPPEMHTAFWPLITDMPMAFAESMYCESCAQGDDDSDEDSPDPFFDNYQPLNVIESWMQLTQSMFPSLVSTFTIGKSWEGRNILGLRLSTSPRDPNQPPPKEPRKTIVLAGGMHAREWISTAVVNYVAWQFILEFTGHNDLIAKFLDHYDIVFLPGLNPDGIEHSWAKDRLWRKTRQPNDIAWCRGADLDHAFSYGWDAPGRPYVCCSEGWGGKEPFEAVEARALRDWALHETNVNNARIVGILDFHSYSQQLLYPYAYSCAEEPPNLENLEELAFGLAKAIRATNGKVYSVSSACHGATTRGLREDEPALRAEYGGGSLVDWFSRELYAHYSFQIKLRDTGNYGFLLPREYIRPTGREMFSAMKYLCDYLLGNNGIEKSLRHKHGATTHSAPEVEPPAEAALETDGPRDRHDELRRRFYIG